MLNRIIRFLFLIPLLLQIEPVYAQPNMRQAALIERRLCEADTYYQQNDFEMGTNRIVEACNLLKQAPQSLPGQNYVQIALNKVDFIDAKLNQCLQRNDSETARKLLSAEQHLLTSLSNWDPQNPKWHYQKAKLFHAESRIPMAGVGMAMANRLGVPNNLHNEVNMQPLQNSIQECERVISSSDPTYRDAAMKLKSACQSEIQVRTGKLNKLHADYYRKLPKGVPPPGLRNTDSPPPAEHYCSKCGGGHESWICPFTHGG